MAIKKKKIKAAASSSGFSIVSNFNNGYRNREDITNLPPGILIKGSQNVLTDVTGRVGITKGYSLDGAASVVLAPILSSFDWEMHTGETRHLRAGFLTSANNDGKLQFRYVSSNDTVTYKDLLTGLGSTNFNFTDYWDNADFQSRLLFVNGQQGIYEWSGGVATLVSATNASGVISELNPTPTAGGSGYKINDVLTITTGGTGATAKVTALTAQGIATFTITSGGSGYMNGNVITVTNNRRGAVFGTLTVTSVDGGGAILTATLTTAGQYYTVGSTYLTTGGAGSGAVITINTVTNGNIESVALITAGSGYTTGAGKVTTTTGLGTGATLNITTVVTGAITISGDRTVGESGFYTTDGALNINGNIYEYSGITGNSFIGIDPSAASEAVGSIIFQVPIFTKNSSLTDFPDDFSDDLISNLKNQIYVGSLQNNEVYVSQVNNYKDYSFASPRAVGEGAILTLDGSPVAFIPQEEQMYISAGKDQWYLTEFVLSSDLAKEDLSVNRLKTTTQQATQSQALTSKIANNVVFVSNEPIISSLGRVDNVVLTPQISDISYPIINDMVDYDFDDGSIFYWRNYALVAIPKNSVVRIYNMTNKQKDENGNKIEYWEAPLAIAISRFSIIDGELYGHSYLTSESYKLFDGFSFNGHPIDARAVFSYMNSGDASDSKSFDEFFVEGYIGSNGTLNTGLNYELDGFSGASVIPLQGTDTQVVQIPASTSSLGKKSLGKNPLGGESVVGSDMPPKFRVIFTFPRTPYYEFSPSFSSVEKDFNWSILRFGPQAKLTSEGNNSIKK